MPVSITQLEGSTPVTTAGAAAIINSNTNNLNNGKLDSSMLDIDSTMAANSDEKIPSQKAVRALVESGGVLNASETNRGLVEEATGAEVTAGTSTGSTGARLFINPSYVAETGNDKIIKTKSTGILDVSILPTIQMKAGGASKNIADADGTQTIAHGLGVAPTLVKISGGVSGASGFSSTATVLFGGVQSSWYSYGDTGSGTVESSGNSFTMKGLDNASNTGVVTVDATNISISWTKSGSPTGTAYMVWEVYR